MLDPGVAGRSGEGRLHLPSIPTDDSGSRGEVNLKNTVLGRRASINPSVPVLGTSRFLFHPRWLEECEKWHRRVVPLAMCSTLSLTPMRVTRPACLKKRKGEQELALWRASSAKLKPPRAACLPGWHECPPPGTANCPAGGRLGTHTHRKTVGERLGSSLGAAVVLPSIMLGGSDPKPLPRSPNFTNNPSTCSLHLLRSRSAQAHPYPCCAFFQLLGHPEQPRSWGAPLSLLSLPRAHPGSVQTQAPTRSLSSAQKFPLGLPGSPRKHLQSQADVGPPSRLPGARNEGAVNGRRAYLGSPSAGRA